MNIIYTKHAKDQIKERKIENVWIEEAIKHPNIIKKKSIKYYIIKKINGIVIKVVFVKQKFIKIITCFRLK